MAYRYLGTSHQLILGKFLDNTDIFLVSKLKNIDRYLRILYPLIPGKILEDVETKADVDKKALSTVLRSLCRFSYGCAYNAARVEK